MVSKNFSHPPLPQFEQKRAKSARKKGTKKFKAQTEIYTTLHISITLKMLLQLQSLRIWLQRRCKYYKQTKEIHVIFISFNLLFHDYHIILLSVICFLLWVTVCWKLPMLKVVHINKWKSINSFILSFSIANIKYSHWMIFSSITE